MGASASVWELMHPSFSIFPMALCWVGSALLVAAASWWIYTNFVQTWFC
jgi:hypothetical protein